MELTRRNLTILLPFLAAAAKGQPKPQPSSVWRYEDLPVHDKTRPVFTGTTHTGFELELHETELGVGEAPHPPHHHPQEEMLLIREGLMEVTISGKTSRLGPGGVAYVASNEEHGWKNAGDTRARYFVIALHGNK